MRKLPSLATPLVLVLVIALPACVDIDERTVVYDARFGEATSMNLFLPESRPALRPAVLLVHGGSWKYFDKESYTSLGRRFARGGFVAASVDYRLVPEGAFPNAAQDVGCALAWLQNHAAELGVDPARIAVFGYSAGAHLGALVSVADGVPGVAPDCAEGAPAPPAGVIAGAGPMDLVALEEMDEVRDFCGGTVAERPDVYALASPITHVDEGDPPFLFVHGTIDFWVPLEQSRRMRDALRSVGTEANLLELRGAAHLLNPSDDGSTFGVISATDLPEVWVAVTDFLDRTVGRP